MKKAGRLGTLIRVTRRFFIFPVENGGKKCGKSSRKAAEWRKR